MGKDNPLNSKVGKSRPKDGLTGHHIPPKHPDKKPVVVLRKHRVHHEAYHTLFAAAKSYDDCCSILLTNWWTDEKGNFIK